MRPRKLESQELSMSAALLSARINTKVRIYGLTLFWTENVTGVSLHQLENN